MILFSTWFDTPLGRLGLSWHAGGLHQLAWPGHALQDAPPENRMTSHPAVEALGGWLSGQQPLPDNLPLAPSGTAFQQRVWQALRQIPAGEVWSYARVAQAIGHPNGVRAVGAAISRNPLPLFLPCHRVIGSNGRLTGFSGGMAAKRWLLEHEGIALHPLQDRLA